MAAVVNDVLAPIFCSKHGREHSYNCSECERFLEARIAYQQEAVAELEQEIKALHDTVQKLKAALKAVL